MIIIQKNLGNHITQPQPPQIEQQNNLVIQNIHQELKLNKIFQMMIKQSYKKITSQYERKYKELFTLIFDFKGNKKLINSLLIDLFFFNMKTMIKNVQRSSDKKILNDLYNKVLEKIKRREEFINLKKINILVSNLNISSNETSKENQLY